MRELQDITERTKELQNALRYLDKSGNLVDIKKKCVSFYENKEDVILYKFIVRLQPCDVLEISAYLGNLVLHKHTEAEHLFQEVVYFVVKSLQLLPADLKRSQVLVSLKIESLPAIKDEYYAQTFQDLAKFQRTGCFLCFDGVVTGLSAVSSYTQSTLYFCPVTGCCGRDDKQYIRVHVPGASELQTIRNDFVCFLCGMVLEEDKSRRVLAEKMIAELVPVGVLNSAANRNGRTQAVPVYFRDDLVGVPVLGELYRVIGLARADLENQNVLLAIEASNVEMISNLHIREVRSLISSLPKSIQQLYEENVLSPWNFVRCLSFLFAGNITPPGSFYKLKLGVLLSLMIARSQHSKAKSFFHILACGRESAMLERLFCYGCRFAERAITHNSCNTITGRICKDPYQKSPFFVEAGSLLLATDGICNIGDLGRYRKVMKDVIKANDHNLEDTVNKTVDVAPALDTGKVVIDVTSRFSQGLPQQHISPLGCQVWAYSDPSHQKPSPYNDELFITGDTGELSKAMLDVFSLVFFTDCSTSSSTMEDNITREILTSAMDSNKFQPSVTFEDFKEFLDIAGRREVTLTPAAEVILQGYYQASRRMRSSDVSGSSVPVATLSTLYSVALAHAKLSLRKEVSESDAVLAVYLCEECLTARYGFSVLSVCPVPHLTTEDFSVEEMDNEMYSFHQRLIRFCGGDGVDHEE